MCLCHSDSPPGSTAARPLWFLRSSWFRMDRVPSGRSECWHACWAFRRTSPPVARPRQTLCLHWLLAPVERLRERGREMGVNAVNHYRACKDWGVLWLTWLETLSALLAFLINLVMRLTQESEHRSFSWMDDCTRCDGAKSELPVNAWLLLRLNAAVLREQRGSDRRQIKCTSGMFGLVDG